MQSLPPSPTEREISVRRKDYLLARLREGVFHPLNWVTGEVDGITYRANGQHSSLMLNGLDGEFPTDLLVHRDHFHCDGLPGLVMLFRQYDPRQSSRTPGDVAGAYQGIQPDLMVVPRWLAKLGIEGVVWYNKQVAGRDVPVGDDIYDVFGDPNIHPFLLWLATVFAGRVNGMMEAPQFAALYATHKANAEAADAFWSELVQGGREFQAEHPTTILYDWLVRLYEKEFKVKKAQKYQGCVYAWNAYREGRESIRDIRCDIRRNLSRVI
jgi:hypothetical protein